jgi:glycosyltransferase involved in cell wall biosynthesis
MRVAFFSPLPPARSGIADYSEALLGELTRLAAVEVFVEARSFDPSGFDIAVYQIGNNSFHEFAYETALAHPGVAVVHEANLHHLICDLTIRRNNWDAYVAEAEYDGGEAAREHALRVRALEAGPDYEGLPMLRRLLERSRAAIVHSRHVRDELRKAGFFKPVAVIPHGAWLPENNGRMAYRQRLGLDEAAPLVGIFGFLKPYKRIAESLRAFRRLVRVTPEAKMILVGEPHPELPLASMLNRLELGADVRVLGFTPIEEFSGYMSACDVILNLRYPTVGESSGTLLRALGLGKAVIVSDVGSFSELPDDVVLKAPAGAGEEDFLFESLNVLVSRPQVAQSMGANARRWVAQQCSWELAARRYADFLHAVMEGRDWPDEPAERTTTSELAAPATEQDSQPEREPVSESYLASWAAASRSEAYLDTHLTRLQRTLEITPRGGPDQRVLEMGAYMQITPALRTKLGYGEVRGCYYGPAGSVDRKHIVSSEGEVFHCEVDLFDAERDRFPYPHEHFSTVICGELIEHLAADPMFLMSEVNRILKPGGHLVITTPNAASLRAISAILQGYHPGFFPAYLRPALNGEQVEARHNREYTPKEIVLLLVDAGFELTLLETGPFRDLPRPEDHWIVHLLERYLLSTDLRGDGIYSVGRKTGPVKQRYPSWLYSGGAQ